jgi:anti-sigma factor RsiW
MVRQHVSPEELQAFVLDEEPLSPTARQHLAECPDCQREVADSQKAVSYLVSRLYRSQCPSATTLSYYCLPNALSEEEQRQVTNHLAHCPLCLAEFADSRLFLEFQFQSGS